MPLRLLDLRGQPEAMRSPFFGLNLTIYGYDQFLSVSRAIISLNLY